MIWVLFAVTCIIAVLVTCLAFVGVLVLILTRK